jgi:hypothetical protein
MADIEKLREEVSALRDEHKVQGARLSMAQAWLQFMQQAFDALLHHGVNYRNLKEYKDDSTLTESLDLPVTKARDNIIGWLGRLTSSLNAAVRRKGMKIVD